ncbi:uncharacterized protein LOC133922758 isoform X1 [Phragmites australis]|uniref:uncharacterized protein LOC133922758 isoform X1 n=1 Tax=Phragmites australis TaxID=29695 RepID=UPI002D77F25B|nr:uncharacterized protein LOC133922758 isoform X1 [Phragmites australis]XP_062224212.1 uncharacterized protein LOC133922758 isoform X1 [Phragmites australis]
MALTKVQRIMTQPINLIFRFLQSKARIQIWLFEQKDLRIEGRIIVIPLTAQTKRISFNFTRNPYFQRAISFACSHNLVGYKIPTYDKLRTTFLKQEMGHIEMLLESSKSTWWEKGVTICANGWSNP